MNHIKAVIFDSDGTLVDSEYNHYLSWKHALVQQGSDLTLEEYHAYVGKSIETNAQLFAEKSGKKENAHEVAKDKIAYFHQLQKQGIPPIEATVNFIHLLADEKKKRGLKLAVATAATKKEVMINLRNLGIEKYFDLVLSGHDDLDEYKHKDPEGVNKPKPYIYLHAAKLLGVKPRDCVVIEDSRSGIAAAENAGCITVAVPNSYTKNQDLTRAHLKIESFANISVNEFLQMTQKIKI